MSYGSEEVEAVITYIHNHLDEELTLERLSTYAAYSPYHFSRVFKAHVGLPPHYYISSIRLQKAKDLLLQTNFSIRDIGLEIGQQSLGTFTTRFTERVGMTPSQFRNAHQETKAYMEQLENLPYWASPSLFSNFNTVTGTITIDEAFHGVILVGLFAKPIPEGLPVYGTLLRAVGDFHFADVALGTYYLMATAVSWGTNSNAILLPHSTLRAKANKPIIINGLDSISHQHLNLHRPRLIDPPILVSLPILMQLFLQQNLQLSK